MPLQATSGAASYDAFGGGVAAVPNYIEDVFSSYLWTTSGSDQTLTTGIDMTKGALTWIKSRSNAFAHVLQTGPGGGILPDNALSSNTTGAFFGGNYRIADSTTGFTMGTDYYTGTPQTAVVWTFREQPKFFDVVTWTGDASGNRVLNHALTSTPACIIIKATNAVDDWYVYHTSLGTNKWLYLNTTSAEQSGSIVTAVSSTTFTVSQSNGFNTSGRTYVAYLFAHNAGGFGLTGTDNVISCGSFSTDGSGNATVSLGYEPQWLMYKCSSSVGDWEMVDVMRGWVVGVNNDNGLRANSSDAESAGSNRGEPSSTGFNCVSFPTNRDFIYIAIRRGPMKVPTSGTSVFAPVLANGGDTTITTNFPVDLLVNKPPSSTNAPYFMDRLRGGTTNTYNILQSSSTAAELVGTGLGLGFQSNVGIQSSASFYTSGTSVLWLNFRRAPSFFDEVCYTGTGSDTTQTHNLGVAPELVIIKSRSNAIVWVVGNTAIGFSNYLLLNATDASASGSNVFNSTAPTSTVFSIGAGSGTNQSGATYVAYLFATCAGVSKVGSYTGTATTKQIDCGFTGGARFVLIKRTDSTGDWYVWDSARGIVSGNDSYLLLNSTAAEVTNTDYVDTYSAGFEISSTAPAAINASGGTFVFLAIA